MRKTSWLAEELLASQEGLFSISYYYYYNTYYYYYQVQLILIFLELLTDKPRDVTMAAPSPLNKCNTLIDKETQAAGHVMHNHVSC